MRVLVTGGVRSGKSAHAESLVADRADVVYVAAGPTTIDGDSDWAARIKTHQARRPATWTTCETRDLVAALANASGPLVIDCLGTWLTGLLDDEGLWEGSSEVLQQRLSEHLDPVCAALVNRRDVVIVTNEVGLGVIPAHRSGRVFGDLLGLTNQRIARACDEVHLVIAGRVLVL